MNVLRERISELISELEAVQEVMAFHQPEISSLERFHWKELTNCDAGGSAVALGRRVREVDREVRDRQRTLFDFRVLLDRARATLTNNQTPGAPKRILDIIYFPNVCTNPTQDRLKKDLDRLANIFSCNNNTPNEISEEELKFREMNAKVQASKTKKKVLELIVSQLDKQLAISSSRRSAIENEVLRMEEQLKNVKDSWTRRESVFKHTMQKCKEEYKIYKAYCTKMRRRSKGLLSALTSKETKSLELRTKLKRLDKIDSYVQGKSDSVRVLTGSLSKEIGTQTDQRSSAEIFLNSTLYSSSNYTHKTLSPGRSRTETPKNVSMVSVHNLSQMAKSPNKTPLSPRKISPSSFTKLSIRKSNEKVKSSVKLIPIRCKRSTALLLKKKTSRGGSIKEKGKAPTESPKVSLQRRETAENSDKETTHQRKQAPRSAIEQKPYVNKEYCNLIKNQARETSHNRKQQKMQFIVGSASQRHKNLLRSRNIQTSSSSLQRSRHVIRESNRNIAEKKHSQNITIPRQVSDREAPGSRLKIETGRTSDTHNARCPSTVHLKEYRHVIQLVKLSDVDDDGSSQASSDAQSDGTKSQTGHSSRKINRFPKRYPHLMKITKSKCYMLVNNQCTKYRNIRNIKTTRQKSSNLSFSTDCSASDNSGVNSPDMSKSNNQVEVKSAKGISTKGNHSSSFISSDKFQKSSRNYEEKRLFLEFHKKKPASHFSSSTNNKETEPMKQLKCENENKKELKCTKQIHAVTLTDLENRNKTPNSDSFVIDRLPLSDVEMLDDVSADYKPVSSLPSDSNSTNLAKQTCTENGIMNNEPESMNTTNRGQNVDEHSSYEFRNVPHVSLIGSYLCDEQVPLLTYNEDSYRLKLAQPLMDISECPGESEEIGKSATFSESCEKLESNITCEMQSKPLKDSRQSLNQENIISQSQTENAPTVERSTSISPENSKVDLRSSSRSRAENEIGFFASGVRSSVRTPNVVQKPKTTHGNSPVRGARATCSVRGHRVGSRPEYRKGAGSMPASPRNCSKNDRCAPASRENASPKCYSPQPMIRSASLPMSASPSRPKTQQLNSNMKRASTPPVQRPSSGPSSKSISKVTPRKGSPESVKSVYASAIDCTVQVKQSASSPKVNSPRFHYDLNGRRVFTIPNTT